MQDIKSPFGTPAYIISEDALRSNGEILKYVAQESGAKVLLAQKAFSMPAAYPILREYLAGTTASGLFEARLGATEFGGETHVFSPAYAENDFNEIIKYAGHIIFNSFGQWKKYRDCVREYCKKDGRDIACGIRVNPEYGEVATDIYNPCSKGSRLGVRPADFENIPEKWLNVPGGIEGLHFHTMCEQGADVLHRTLPYVEKHFGDILKKMRWLNMGGGQHITKKGYDLAMLISDIKYMMEKYDIDIYIEPGEAVALDAGWLESEVLDIINADVPTAILDASAACHMPDVLEMPYRPEVVGASLPWEKKYTYRLCGNTCLAGDVIGMYSFDAPLAAGTRLLFCDMAIYTMVKNNTFNGMPLPSIVMKRSDGSYDIIRKFGYLDFYGRLVG